MSNTADHSWAHSLLDIFEIIADAKIEEAGYDKTTPARIVSRNDINTYTVSHQGKNYTAKSLDGTADYAIGADVYIISPSNDESQTYLILGLVQEHDIGAVTIEDNYANIYDYTGANILNYYTNENNSTISTSNTIEIQPDSEALTSVAICKKLLFKGDFTVNSNIDDIQTRLNLKYALTFKFTLDGKQSIYYAITQDDVQGDPFALSEETQEQIFDFSSYTFDTITLDAIELTVENPDENKNAEITVKNLKLYPVERHTKLETEVQIFAPEGDKFIEDETILQLEAKARLNGKLVNVTKYHWAVYTTPDITDELFGAGWARLNLNLNQPNNQFDIKPFNYLEQQKYKCAVQINEEWYFSDELSIENPFGNNLNLSLKIKGEGTSNPILSLEGAEDKTDLTIKWIRINAIGERDELESVPSVNTREIKTYNDYKVIAYEQGIEIAHSNTVRILQTFDNFTWHGELSTAPDNPKINDAYYNTTDGVSYIYDGKVWTSFAKGAAIQYTMDLSNDMDLIPADSEGNLAISTTAYAITETLIQVLKDSQPLEIQLLNGTGIAKDSDLEDNAPAVQARIGKLWLTGLTQSEVNNISLFSFNLAGEDATERVIFYLRRDPGVDSFPVTFYYQVNDSLCLQKTFSLAKQKSEPGVKPIDYYLELSKTGVNVTKESQQVTVKPKKKIGPDIQDLDANETWDIAATPSYWLRDEQGNVSNSILEIPKGAAGDVTVVLTVNGIEWDIETISVVVNGEKGDTKNTITAYYRQNDNINPPSKPAEGSSPPKNGWSEELLAPEKTNKYIYASTCEVTNGTYGVWTNPILSNQWVEDGATPYIKDGNWWIGDTDLGIVAEGSNGDTPFINADGYWQIGANLTEIKAQGPEGISITSVINYYYATASEEEQLPEKGNDNWKTLISDTGYGENKKYLWNYEKVTYSGDKAPTTTNPSIITTWGTDGRGIQRIEEWYARNNDATTKPSTGWDNTPESVTSSQKYLWNYQIIYYSDGSSTGSSNDARIIGAYGEDGATKEEITAYWARTGTNNPPAVSDKPSTGSVPSDTGINSWSLTNPGLSPTNYEIYISKTTKTSPASGNSTYGEWSAPVLLTQWAKDGSQGPVTTTNQSVKYAYYLSDSSISPNQPDSIKTSTDEEPELSGGWTWPLPVSTEDQPWIHRVAATLTTETITTIDSNGNKTTSTSYSWSDWSAVEIYSYKGNTNSDIIKRVSTFENLTSGGDYQGIYYAVIDKNKNFVRAVEPSYELTAEESSEEKSIVLYLNSEMIQTKGIRVADINNMVIFEAQSANSEETEGFVNIAGWDVSSSAFKKNDFIISTSDEVSSSVDTQINSSAPIRITSGIGPALVEETWHFDRYNLEIGEDITEYSGTMIINTSAPYSIANIRYSQNPQASVADSGVTNIVFGKIRIEPSQDNTSIIYNYIDFTATGWGVKILEYDYQLQYNTKGFVVLKDGSMAAGNTSLLDVNIKKNLMIEGNLESKSSSFKFYNVDSELTPKYPSLTQFKDKESTIPISSPAICTFFSNNNKSLRIEENINYFMTPFTIVNINSSSNVLRIQLDNKNKRGNNFSKVNSISYISPFLSYERRPCTLSLDFSSLKDTIINLEEGEILRGTIDFPLLEDRIFSSYYTKYHGNKDRFGFTELLGYSYQKNAKNISHYFQDIFDTDQTPNIFSGAIRYSSSWDGQLRPLTLEFSFIVKKINGETVWPDNDIIVLNFPTSYADYQQSLWLEYPDTDKTTQIAITTLNENTSNVLDILTIATPLSNSFFANRTIKLKLDLQTGLMIKDSIEVDENRAWGLYGIFDITYSIGEDPWGIKILDDGSVYLDTVRIANQLSIGGTIFDGQGNITMETITNTTIDNLWNSITN